MSGQRTFPYDGEGSRLAAEAAITAQPVVARWLGDLAADPSGTDLPAVVLDGRLAVLQDLDRWWPAASAGLRALLQAACVAGRLVIGPRFVRHHTPLCSAALVHWNQVHGRLVANDLGLTPEPPLELEPPSWREGELSARSLLKQCQARAEALVLDYLAGAMERAGLQPATDLRFTRLLESLLRNAATEVLDGTCSDQVEQAALVRCNQVERGGRALLRAIAPPSMTGDEDSLLLFVRHRQSGPSSARSR
jgi:hypothetical protein